MKNTFGNSVCLTIFGESHGDMIGAVIDGLAPGIEIDGGFIESRLTLRRPQGNISTKRVEADEYKIVSGVFNGKTTGTPVCILIPNTNTKSADYERTKALARPGHADYTANIKYHGFEDYRGGGHFSGRITAAVVAAGAIIISALKKNGIYIGTHIKKCTGVSDIDFNEYKTDIEKLNNSLFPVLSNEKKDEMLLAIENAANQCDSVGGVLETVVIGVPAGVGEPWFDSLEGVLSHALFAIPGIKGIEFGAGFNFAEMKGSEANDAFYAENGNIYTKTNNNGGINGGISNGMPLLFRCAVKPTPSIYKSQNTVDINTCENTVIEIKGRHDPAIIHRARVVVDSITALVLADMLAQKFGTDFLGGEK
ncbi:MAG: chorismate synthase [Oscillospiraceae bacterium]|nr:chorismate synthase [Oscillospiraceae bacterium]